MSWSDVIAIIVSVVALVLSAYQFLYERKRNRMQATIDAFAELQKEVLNNDAFVDLSVTDVLEKHKSIKPGEIDNTWTFISECLAKIEQFAVGINTKVYSINILDRMAGSHIIKEYYRFQPIISYKREKSHTDKRYIEFEKMANALRKYNTM